MSENSLNRLMNPSSIATFGAGNNFMKMGTLQTLSIVKDGFQGKVFPVHPRESEVMGLTAFPSVEDLPETPDLAFIVVPSSRVVPIMEALGKRGTQRAIVITAGFGETGEDGTKIQEQLDAVCQKYGIRYLGPNCMGVINSEISLNTTVMPYTCAKGSLGFASQSGTYITQTLPYLKKRGIRFSKAISVGNSANIDITDALEYLGADEQTRAIGLYIESVKDVRRFVEVARKITPEKPVLAQYVGGSLAGARSALGHTGAMAAPDHLYDGMFKQAGVIRVHSIEELYNYGNMLALQPPLCGRRVGIVTNSGGPGSAIANALEKGGMTVPRFSEALQSRIRPLIYDHAPCGNPVDLTFHLDVDVLAYKIPAMILESGEVDALIIHGSMRKGYFVEIYEHISSYLDNAPLENLMADFSPVQGPSLTIIEDHGKPVGISSFFGREDDYSAAYQDSGLPVIDAPEETANAMAALYRHFEIRQRPAWQPPEITAPPDRACELIAACLCKGQNSMDEYDARQFLRAWGLPVTEEVKVQNSSDAVAAAAKIGFPLALKACAPDILHKTGHGLVVLNVNSEEETIQAYDRIQKARGKAVPVLVSPMVQGDREFAAGIVTFEGFGPSVMFSLGGIFAEALNDAVFRPAPLSVEDAAEMIKSIRTQKLLGPVRGMPAVDIEKTAQVLSRLSLIPLAHPEIGEIDINPMIIQGDAPVAVDAVVVLNCPV